ncbi:sugar phosphate nucleotidyltransferase [Desertimonas flava]|uniref:sugar phosphate nucleotidyltransferase n=1 Tax=Desertimonas flava TaxID=2064846 RepID=UPI000E340C55|nr:sugar phosphate nucleotidyltransferase [Desertimonas flava]
MKVVLFCGGMGMRLRDYSDQIPKPLVEVGQRPILWHLMKHYSHFGHTEFILCLGHGAGKIKQYFLDYNECANNDFVFSDGGRRVTLLNSDIDDWTITFADTGLSSNVGERLRRVRAHLGDDEMFLANYADGLSDLNLETYVKDFEARDKTACFLSVPAPHTFHIVHADSEHCVTHLEHIARSPVRINAGFFVFRREIFDVMNPGEELVVEPFQKLIERRQLLAMPYDGFWQNMDTFKDKIALDEMVASGSPPWQAFIQR